MNPPTTLNAGHWPSAEPSQQKVSGHPGAVHFTFDRYLTYAQTLGDPTAIQSARAAIAEGIGAGPQPTLIHGRDVLAAVGGSRKPGPWVGELVDRALDHQHRGDFDSREAALRWITEEIPRRT